jgi:hypothetical protein
MEVLSLLQLNEEMKMKNEVSSLRSHSSYCIDLVLLQKSLSISMAPNICPWNCVGLATLGTKALAPRAAD